MLLDDKTRADLGWDALLEALAARAHTLRGAEQCRVLPPLDDASAVRARLDEVSEARALYDEGQPMPIDGVRSLDDALARADKGGALDPPALRDIASTLTAGARVRRHLVARAQKAPRLLGRASLIADLVEVAGPLEDSFEPSEAPGGLRLRDRASPALGGLRRRALKVRDELERKAGSLLEASHVAPHLQDHFTTQREDRFVIPIRADARSKVRGIVHGVSQSGQTVFVEPEEIVELNNALKLAELEVADEERRILAELTALVSEALPRIRVNLEVLAALDVLDAAARLSIDLRGTAPEIADDDTLDLRRARHPLMILSGRQCVPNDIKIGGAHTLVISGPNAGGKTVALKTAGLCAMLLRTGLHVPAQEGSRLPLYTAVRSDVGDDQSLERNLSTFSAHVLRLRELMGEARPGVLLLLDEVAVGTDPDQGAALAQAVLEALVSRGATTLVTTHYDRLKALAARDQRFANAAVGFDVETLQPTYVLHLGVPGASGAVVVARRLGLDEAVCTRATSLAGDTGSGLEALLLSLEQERRKLTDEREQIEAERRHAETERDEAGRKLEEAREKLDRARKGAHDEAVQTLQRARQELDRTRAVLRRTGGKVTPAEVIEARREIDQLAQQVNQSAPPPPEPPGRPAQATELTVGRDVFVARLGGRAKVLSPPKSNKVVVQAGPLKVTVPVEEIRIVEGQKAPQSSARTRRGHNAFDEAAPAPGPSPPGPRPRLAAQGRATRGRYPQLDVRGERVDAAIGLAEKFLDDALRSGQDGVLIIHGHGTGALRDKMREHLRDFPGVGALRPGNPDEGGDGVTVVTLA